MTPDRDTFVTRAYARLAALAQPIRTPLVVAVHAALAAAAYLGAWLLAGNFRLSADAWQSWLATLPYLVAARLVLFERCGLFRAYWCHVGVRDLLYLVTAVTLGSLAFAAILAAVRGAVGVPAAVLVVDWLVAIALSGGARLGARFLREGRGSLARRGRGTRTFILGAGAAGEQLLREILHDPQRRLDVVGLIDDDPAKRGRALHGVAVLGTPDELHGLVAYHRVSRVLIAIPSATPEQLRRLVNRCSEAGVDCKVLPPLHSLVSGDVHVAQLRDVRIEDLLGREPVQLDLGPIAPEVAGKTVLITGAGGSIGSELARQLARFNPLRLVLLDRAESPLYFAQLDVAKASPGTDVVPVLASVTNADRLARVFETYRPDLVFHAAAYKHVPMLEWNLVEGIWNNVVGTLRTARCAVAGGVKRFVLISTDKAVSPTSVLGATKRLAERIVLELPSLRTSTTDFRVVRFGNVLGSDGSVVPLFQRQLAAGGPLTVTHPDVQRFFMTIPEAVQLVLQAAALPDAAGRIALLEMGDQVRVLDLAEQMIRLSGLTPHRDIAIVFTGLRPGEKIREELVAAGESAIATAERKIRVVEPNAHDGALLAKRLRHLIGVTIRHDAPAIVRAIAALVPDYEPAQPDPAPRAVPVSLPRRNGAGHRPPALAVAGNGHG